MIDEPGSQVARAFAKCTSRWRELVVRGRGGTVATDARPMAEGEIVLVTELGDPDDAGRFSGLFAAHMESESPERSKMGPIDVPVEEAISWGRSQAEVVLVRVGDGDDGEYSAGSREVQDDGIRPWPSEGLKIAARPEKSALDGSEQIVPWRVEAEASLSSGSLEEAVLRLSSGEEVIRAGMTGRSATQFEFVLEAPGTRSAGRMAWRLASKAFEEVDRPPGPKSLLLSLKVTRAVT